MAMSPFQDRDRKPSLESLEIFLGRGEFIRFKKIYIELMILGYNPNPEWKEQDGSWFFRYYRDGNPLFDLQFSDGNFTFEISLASDDYLTLTRSPAMTDLALKLLRKHPENKVRKMVWVEAQINKMSEQEGFFDLLPALTIVLLG